jgi:hypothetical protein
MSTWLRDGKSAIQEAVADAFDKIEEGAKASMQPFLLEENSPQLFSLLILIFRARRARSEKRRAVVGATAASGPRRQCCSATARK